MLRKRYYILFVARDDDGRVRKIPLPLRYVYGFVAAALVGTFTIVGLADDAEITQARDRNPLDLLQRDLRIIRLDQQPLESKSRGRCC